MADSNPMPVCSWCMLGYLPSPQQKMRRCALCGHDATGGALIDRSSMSPAAADPAALVHRLARAATQCKTLIEITEGTVQGTTYGDGVRDTAQQLLAVLQGT